MAIPTAALKVVLMVIQEVDVLVALKAAAMVDGMVDQMVDWKAMTSGQHSAALTAVT